MKNFSHILFRRCGPHVVASLFCILRYVLNLTVPHWRQLKLQLPEVSPSAVILLNARQSKSSFRRASAITLEVIFVIGQYLVDSSVAACCLQFGIFFWPFCNGLSLFLGNILQAVWSGSIGDFRRSSIYPLVSFKKSCSRDLESCNPSPLLKKSHTLRFGPEINDNVLRDIVYTRLGLSLRRRISMGSGNVSLSGWQNFKRGSS